VPHEDRSQGTAGAAFVGWRFLIIDDDEVLGAVHVGGRRTGQMATPASDAASHEVQPFADYACGFIEGGLAIATGDALLWAEQHYGPIQSGDYRVRLLTLPGADCAALWLVADGDASEYLIPLDPDVSASDPTAATVSPGWGSVTGPEFLDRAARQLHPVEARPA
jgi:hypothetical protein